MAFTGDRLHAAAGAVELLLLHRLAVVLGSYKTVGTPPAPSPAGSGWQEDADVLGAGEDAAMLAASPPTTDARSTRAREPRVTVGAAQLTFTRWDGFSPGRYVPGRTVR